ncbi:oligosaccharide flippase family protein [Saccharospirillum salsuginis]|uniref:Lipopolysaccharide biosynthesis protein n=1 Tax=Saccharospirillum salsuginis TaxID=418750 RepID=A0A918K4L0_9GAMM|nr:oligosaccharide flippase family protein [Saccharospirillum salsuginis]GGX49720.1 lipopolysaccharide biosynthesis protein [Saccharospirillum salsuginis]
MSVTQGVLKSSGFLVAIQFLQRTLGIISTLILARLLAPEHFGIVALVTIALQFFELLVETGNQQYIVQKDSVVDDDLNTAWTLDILMKSGIAVLIIIASPALARYFETPALTSALPIASLALPIRALKTPELMLLARNLNYRPVFWLNLWQKGVAFVFVVGIALVHASHWAIIIGNLISAAILALGSYRVCAYRPSMSLKRVWQQWHFSRWLLMRGLVGFTRSQIDNLMVSKLFGSSSLGGYNLVRELSILPAVSVIIPMSQPLLAAIAQGRDDPAILAYRIRFSLALATSILLPVSVFMLAYPELIVTVLLGQDWQPYAHLMAAFALFFITFCLFALISDAVIALGRVKSLFIFDLSSTILIFTILWLWGRDSLWNMAWLRGWLAMATTLALLVVLNRWSALGLRRYLWLCLPSALGCLSGLGLSEWTSNYATGGLPGLMLLGAVFMAGWAGTTLTLLNVAYARSEEFRHARRLVELALLHRPFRQRTTSH